MAQHPIGLNRELSGARAEQVAVFETIRTGPRGSVPSPFLAMLDAPALADAIQGVGTVIRFGGSLPDRDRELAILTTAGVVRCGYEWRYHAPIALDAGADPAAVELSWGDREPTELDDRSATIVQLCRSATRDRRIDRSLLDAAIESFGREGTTELLAICGYYALLASFIIVGGHDVDPAGETPVEAQSST